MRILTGNLSNFADNKGLLLADEIKLFGLSHIMQKAILLVVGVCILSLSSRVTVPIGFVPVTLQTLAVLSIAFAYGKTLGFATVFAWLVAGFTGLPVFAAGSGPAYMMGPTAGYLFGMLVSSYLVGFMAEKGMSRHPLLVGLAMVIGNLVIYSFGVAWLGNFVGYGSKVFTLGVIPFLFGDLAKIVIAAIAFPTTWKLVSWLNR